MEVIIAGSRYKDRVKKIEFDDYEMVKQCIKDSGFEITEVVCGEALGVDRLGRRYAEENNIPIKSFPVTSADWLKYGKSAGFRRNHEMGDYANALIAIRMGKSGGTTDMINYATQKGLKVYVKDL